MATIETLEGDKRVIDPALVQMWIAAQGNKAVTVTFVKKDGTITTRNGLPQVYSRRVGGERGEKQAATLRKHGNLFFDYPRPMMEGGKLKRGFSFNAARVLEIKAQGAILSPS